MAVNNTTNIPPMVRDFAIRNLLMVAYPPLVHAAHAAKYSIPVKSGDTAVWRGYTRLPTATAPLVDGVTSAGALMSQSTIKAVVKEFGNFVYYTDQLKLIVEDNTIGTGTTLLGENLGESVDEMYRDVLASCSFVYQAAAGGNLETPTEITQTDINRVWTAMLSRNAKFISNYVDPSKDFATVPLLPAYWGVIHTDLLPDLELCTDFVGPESYGQAGAKMPYEAGSTRYVRWQYSSIAAVSAAAVPVYSLPITGKEAYGGVSIGPKNGEFFIEPLGSSGSADPLHQRGSMGYKHWFASRYLNDNFGSVLEVTKA